MWESDALSLGRVKQFCNYIPKFSNFSAAESGKTAGSTKWKKNLTMYSRTARREAEILISNATKAISSFTNLFILGMNNYSAFRGIFHQTNP